MYSESLQARHMPAYIQKVAEQVLQNAWDAPVKLGDAEIIPSLFKSVTVRCRVIDGTYDMPGTVFVKKFNELRDDAWHYLPESPEFPNIAHVCFDEWSALQCLDTLPVASKTWPQFYGGDREAGVIVMEDIGVETGPSLYDDLHGDDPEAATAGLLEYAAALGRYHAATLGDIETYRTIRDSLGPKPLRRPLYDWPWSPARCEPVPEEEVHQTIASYKGSLDTLGIKPPPDLEEEIFGVTQRVEESPDDYLALCAGDQGANCFLRIDGKLLIHDFDCAGYRHAFIEGMPGRMTIGSMRRIPDALQPQLDRAYRKTFSTGCPQLTDDRIYAQALVDGCAWWHLFHMIHRLPGALEGDRPRGDTSLRQQVLAWIDAFALLSREYDTLPSLGTAAYQISNRLKRVWPAEVAVLPYYPAFEKTV